MRTVKKDWLETFRKLYVGETPEASFAAYKKRQWCRSLLLFGFTLFLTLVFCLAFRDSGHLIDGSTLQRPEAKDGEEDVCLRVRGTPEELQLQLKLVPKDYSEEEAYRAFDREFLRLKEGALADNIDYNCVSRNLNFSLKPADRRIKASWDVADGDYISGNGLIRTDTVPEEGIYTSIILTLKYKDFQRQYPVFMKLVRDSDEQNLVMDFQAYVQEELLRQSNEANVRLPSEFEGYQLSYENPADIRFIYIFILGMFFIFGCCLSDKEKLNRQLKKRNREMMLDYSEIICHLVLLVTCGLSVRNAWEKVCKDYIHGVRSNRKKKHYAYDEMVLALCRMENGISEAKAYGGFGVSCGLHTYVKLGRLLEQNIRIGNKHLKILLEAEVFEAFLQRKNQARIMGEEAGTKLLFPMFLMLLMLLIILMVPALMTFTI